MGLLSKAFAPSGPEPTLTRDMSPDMWFQSDLFSTDAGIYVSAETVMRCATVYAAVRVMSETLATLPLKIYRRRADEGADVDRGHYAHVPLTKRPNAWQTSVRWRQQMAMHFILWQNAYSRIRTDVSSSQAFELWPLNPSVTKPVNQLADGRLVYLHTPNQGAQQRIVQDEMLHFRGLSENGFEGKPLYQLMRNAVAVALAAERHNALFLNKGARLSGILSTEQALTEDQETELSASWARAYAGLDNVGKVAVLQHGMTFTNTAVDNQKAQHLELQDWQVGQLLRFIGTPGVLVGYADKTATYASAEQFFLSFAKHGVAPKSVNWQEEIEFSLIEGDEHYVRFLLDALERGDILTRYRAHQIAILTGWKTRNEVRRIEDQNPGGPELDEFLEPQNMAPVGAADPTSGGQSDPPPNRGARSRPPSIRLQEFALAAATRVIRREISAIHGADGHMGYAVRLAKDPSGWKGWLAKFYGELAPFVAETMRITLDQARSYCEQQRAAVLESGVGVVRGWEGDRAAELAGLALVEE